MTTTMMEETSKTTTKEMISRSYRVNRRRKVWFNRIEINEHPYELGDNPSVSDGAPLTIAWKSQAKTVFEIEYYETYRPSSERRKKNDLRLSVSERAQM